MFGQEGCSCYNVVLESWVTLFGFKSLPLALLREKDVDPVTNWGYWSEIRHSHSSADPGGKVTCIYIASIILPWTGGLNSFSDKREADYFEGLYSICCTV